MTQPATADHSRSGVVELAAMFAADQPAPPTVQELQRQYGLTPDQACEAMIWAKRMKICRAAFS